MNMLGTALVALTFISFAMTASAQSAAPSWTFPDYSATQILSSARYEIPMTVYRSGASVRAQYNPRLARLFISANSKVYNLTVYPDGSRTCVAAHPDKGMGMPNLLELFDGVVLRRTPVGEQVVQGHKASVEDVAVRRPDGTSVEFKVWLVADLKGVPVKIESQHTGMKLTAVYRDVKFGAPDKTLFSVPGNCIPIEKMGQVVEHKVYN